MPEHTVQFADRPTAPRVLSECRVYQRQACDLSASCQPVSAWGRKDSRWAAVISDISQGGIRLIVQRRFEPGVGLGIELPGSEGEEPSIVLAKVVHVRGLPDGSWALGCKFISELGEDEVQRLLPHQHPSSQQPAEATPAPIAPSQHKQVAAVTPVQETVSETKTIAEVTLQLEIPPGRVINCRIQRLSVPGTWPLAAGKTLAIRTNNPTSPLPLLKLKVVRCILEGDRWTLRCRLLNPPSDELLRTLCPPAQVSAGMRTS